MKATAFSLRTLSEVSPLERFDAYSVLAKSPLFIKYPSTLSGFKAFWHDELKPANVRFETGSVIIGVSNATITSPLIPFLQLVVLPFYHCQWDLQARVAIEEIVTGTLTDAGMAFAFELLQASAAVELDMIPYDWRDIVEDMITAGKMDLSKFRSVSEVERAVDEELRLQSQKSKGSEEGEGSEVEGEGEVSEEDRPHPQAPNPRYKLMNEDKLILARTFGLDPEEFSTKEEAMKIFESRR